MGSDRRMFFTPTVRQPSQITEQPIAVRTPETSRSRGLCTLVARRSGSVARSTVIVLIQPGAHSRSALRTTTTESGRPAAGADRQFTRLTAPDMRRRHAELFGNLIATASRAPCDVGGAANQGFESVVTGLTIILIKRHGWKDSSEFSIIAPGRTDHHPIRCRSTSSGALTVFSKSRSALSTPPFQSTVQRNGELPWTHEVRSAAHDRESSALIAR